MQASVLYQLLNIIMVAAVLILIKLIYDRLEVVSNRCLLVATLGMAIDLVAWFSISHSSALEAAIVCLRLSIIGRLLFGLGFIYYMSRECKAKYPTFITALWGVSIVGTFVHTFRAPVDNAYLSDLCLFDVTGIVVLRGTRGVLYYTHLVAAFLVGIWSIVLIINSLIRHKGRLENKVIVNALFYLASIIVQGISVANYEINYDVLYNYTPLTRAFATGIYAYLSFKYNFLNYDRLAGKSLVSDIGAGFIVLSAKYEVLYANDIAFDLYPDLIEGNVCSAELKEAISRQESKFEKNGFTYKVTADRLVANGKIEGYTILASDISDVVQLERDALKNEEARKNLLINISHELKTPLNALMGASEMMKNEDLSAEAYKEYAEVVRVSTMNLNDILNDILSASSDYEKVQTFDMAPYSICTLVDNVVDMCNERVARKSVEFYVSVAEDIPVNAIGDDHRIRQVLLNVLTNAIRYTADGSVSLKVSGEYLSDGRFEYVYTIRDTGRNVFKTDINFEEYMSKGNELGMDFSTGYGISLMVAKKIAKALDGDLSVCSIKNKVNVYSIRIPSQLLDRKTLSSYEFDKKLRVSFYGNTEDLFLELKKTCNRLKILNDSFQVLSRIRKATDETRYPILIYDYEKYGRKIAASEKAKSYVHVAVLTGNSTPKELDDDCIFVRAPLSAITINKIFLEQEKRVKSKKTAESNAFICPQAKILVVDDNTLNLQIARTMLEQFKATVDVAESGYECLEMLMEGKKYDLIFLDYMMEGMDGIEAARKIRALKLPIKDVVIIAFTANTVKGAKEKYLEAGMDGCLFKPASTEAFAACLRAYLKRDLLIFEHGTEAMEKPATDYGYPVIEGIDTEAAARYTGCNKKLFLVMLRDFVNEVEEKESKMLALEREGNYKDFVVMVHGIKGMARTLGMIKLSEKMYELEKAGNDRDEAFIKANMPEVLSFYRKQAALAEPFAEKEEKKIVKIPSDSVERILLRMHEKLEEFEMDDTEELFKELWPADYDEIKAPLMKGLKEAIDRVDYYASMEYVEKLLDCYEH